MNQIIYVGYDGIHPQNFTYDIPNGFDSFLLVVTKTPVFITSSIRNQGISCSYSYSISSQT